MRKSDRKPENTDNVVASIKSVNKTISNAYADIDALVCKCWQQGCSFRLLSALMRTKRYDTIYCVLIRAKAFVCCDRGAPSHYDKEIIEEIPLEIMEAMKKRHITVRRWCQSYGFDLCDLWYQVNPNKEILLSLQEDFPEVFGLQLQEYKTAPVCCDRKSFFGGKMGRHIIWSNYYNIRVQHTRENEAIRLFNWRKSLVIVKRRLQIYLEKGLAEALAWPPSELVRVSIDRKTEQKRKLTDDPAEVARKEKLHEAMQRESEIDSLIRKIAALPLPQFCRRDDRAKELELQTILTETYGVSLKKIDYDVYKIRWDANRY